MQRQNGKEASPRRRGRPPRTILGTPTESAGTASADLDARLVAALEELGKKRHRIAEAKAAKNPVEAERERLTALLQTAAAIWRAARPKLDPVLRGAERVVEEWEGKRLPWRRLDWAIRTAHSIVARAKQLRDLISKDVVGPLEDEIGKITVASMRSDFPQWLQAQIVGLETRAADAEKQHRDLVFLVEELAKEDLDPDAFAAFTLIRPGPEERQEQATAE